MPQSIGSSFARRPQVVFSAAGFSTAKGKFPFKARVFRECVVVHPDVGMRMEKLPFHLQPYLPGPMVRLMDMWNVALQSKSGTAADAGSGSIAPCVVCDGGADASAPVQCPL
eukprot:142339-Pyramimonas_sp.AAC.1